VGPRRLRIRSEMAQLVTGEHGVKASKAAKAVKICVAGKAKVK
jgi:hypothetical protein